LLVGAVVFVFPLYMTVMIALKTPADMTTLSGILSIPSDPQWGNFVEAARVADLLTAFRVSVTVTSSSVVLTVLTSSMVGYAIGRNPKSRLYRILFLYFVSAMFVPFAVIMLPIARQMAFLDLDTVPGLIILYTAYGVPLSVFLYVGGLKSVPVDFDEAAWIDGASVFYSFRKLIFPLLKPVHATVVIHTAVWTWNDFLLPLIILGARRINTLALAQHSFEGQFTTDYNLGFASYLIALLPMIVIFLAAQKLVVSGLTGGGLK